MKSTRKTRAAELLKLAIEGPSFDKWQDPTGEAANLYRLWSESWLLPRIKELVPEIAKGQVQYIGVKETR